MISKFLAVVIMAMAVAMVWQKFQIDSLTIDNLNLTTERDAAVASVVTLTATIDFQAEQVDRFEERIAEMSIQSAQNRKQVEYLRSLFGDHDFTNLVNKKPGLIEKRMQAATAKVLKELADVTSD